MLKPMLIAPKKINVKSIKNIFAELKIYDNNSNKYKKINLNKFMQTLEVLKKVKETLYNAMHFT
ncbi:773_t:CDS:1, partial [Cetraspora pellucida]